MISNNEGLDEDIIREERKVPEQDLTDGKMMNDNDNGQTSPYYIIYGYIMHSVLHRFARRLVGMMFHYGNFTTELT